jgi:TonB-linked SusC/RagA family outer membrane protein
MIFLLISVRQTVRRAASTVLPVQKGAVLLLLLLILNGSAFSQQPDERISLHFSNLSVKDAFLQIESRSGYTISYPTQGFNAARKITLQEEAISVKNAMEKILLNTGFTFLVKNKTILIREKMQESEANRVTQTGTLTGKVTDDKGNPLSSASITVSGIRKTIRTADDGSFRVYVPAGTYSVEASFISFEVKQVSQVLVQPSAVTNIDIVLIPANDLLTSVVVTALGITKEKRQLGYASQEIKGEDINTARTTNMFEGLQGRVAGLNMTQASSGLTKTARIVLRGESSLNINKNQALIVVDGVPINNVGGTASSNDLPIDYGSGGAEINPDDIESINILKGPNAAALYGSRAAAGVIVIKTKRASNTKDLGVTLNSSVVFDNVLKLPDFQNEYGGGTGVGLTYYSYGDGPDGPNTSNSGHNWGAPFAGQSFVQYGSPLDATGKRTRSTWEAHPDNVKDFYVTGKTISNSLSLSKSNELSSFRASYSNFFQTGIMPNTELKRHLFNINSSIHISPKLVLNSNINYINSSSDNLPVVGYGSGSPTYNFIWFERNADINWFKDYWVKGQEGIKQAYYFTWGDNPYMTMYEQLNGLKRNRVFGNASLNYNITDHLSFLFRTGIDYSGDIRISRRPIGSVVALTGLYRRQDYTYFERNSDFLFTYDRALSKDFKWSVNAGGNNLQINTFNNTTTANGLVIPKVYNLGNASSRPAISENNTLKLVNSLYAFTDLGYKNQVFLQLTARNDWSSTLPKANNSYFYPSASVSAIASDIFNIRSSVLNYWKLRTSYASVGNDTDPYQTDAYYDYSSLPGGVTLPGTLSNRDLKPEITTSFEIGTELKLLQNRVGIDFSYYSTISKNQILSSPLALSSGYSGQIMNAGKISNKGVELAVKLTPVKTKLNWDVTVTGSANRSKVVTLAEGVSSYVMASGQGATIEAREGGAMGDIYGIGFSRNTEGKIIYKAGVPVFTTQKIKIGNYNPDFIAGIHNSFRYGGFAFSFLFDGKFGGTIFSATNSTGAEAGSLELTLPGRKDGIVGDGVVLNADNKTYSPNTEKVAAYTYYRGYYKRPNVEANSFDATFVKLREVLIGYSIPAARLRKTPFKSIQLNLTGRNLLLFAKAPGIDPETAFVTGATIVPGIENAQIPSTRSMGIDLKVSF